MQGSGFWEFRVWELIGFRVCDALLNFLHHPFLGLEKTLLPNPVVKDSRLR